MKCLKCSNETGADWKTLCLFHYKNRSIEEIRADRQKRLDKKVARMRTKADRLDARGSQKKAELEAYHGDIAFFTQPNINTSKGRAFTKYREKLSNRFDAGIKLQLEADELRKNAEWMEKGGVRVKGDAERARQQEREELDKVISVGSIVHDILYSRNAEVVKVNKKTYTLRTENGSTFTRDKTFVEPVKNK